MSMDPDDVRSLEATLEVPGDYGGRPPGDGGCGGGRRRRRRRAGRCRRQRLGAVTDPFGTDRQRVDGSGYAGHRPEEVNAAAAFIRARANHWSGVRFEVGWKIGSRSAGRSSPVDTIASNASLITANRPCAGVAVGPRR
jgi:hypothetical protein